MAIPSQRLDGEPTVERIGEEFEMRAYFYPEETDGARFVAHLTNLTGIRATFEVKAPAN